MTTAPSRPIADRRVAVVGLGVSGNAALRLLRRRGVAALASFDHSTVKNADYNDPTRLIEDFKPDLLVVSPGVPLASPWIAAYIDAGGELSSELDLAYAELHGEQLLGVTGSLGKSTTVALIEAAIRTFDPAGCAVGNIGYPLADYVSDVAEGKRPRARWLVCELSSYQLENLRSLRFAHVAITYLSANHLDRYASKETYYGTKWRLLELTDGNCVLNARGGDLARWAAIHESPKVVVAQEFEPGVDPTDLMGAKLFGSHNRDNILVAHALTRLAGFPVESERGLLEFGGLAHRLERVGDWGGLVFVNDSKATTMESVLTAFHSTEESFSKGEIWLLLGGKDKNLPWSELATLKAHSRLKPIYFGACAEIAAKGAGIPGPIVPGLRAALEEVKRGAHAGDVVLLSPGGSSLDEFKNFEDRGRQFAELGRTLFAT